ncbi:TIGR03749 family integrating conjugative element protein [Xanthomonas euvesicatoria]|uniref:TIGR03749 family integrating conjugative element protein n=1 Tax=Xanthomonas citri TaxID=346 RepID=UPI000F7FDFBC|nr:TIGR03749 family integrating conjugative element protein [Xanthomonas axonopodis]MEE5091084.1 TIGR03749 family integrating conjugative element protein [Xanthomonas euvesicatoria]RTE56871.1 TIGR03749 family integrating conjugative element protein [Xanthomonas axonopodis pv. eucalyptorum]
MTRTVSIRVLAFALCATLWLGNIPSVQAMQILRWERMPLTVPLRVGEERVVFIDRNVRVGVPSAIADRLRVQSAGGAIYLRASAAIEPTRLQLQDADSGALILIDIATEAPKEGQSPLEPVRIVEGDTPGQRYGEPDRAADTDTGTGEQPSDTPTLWPDETGTAERHDTPVAVVLTRYAAQNLYAPLRTVEPVRGVSPARVRSDLDLEALAPALPVRAKALGAWTMDDQWVTAVRLTNTSPRWLDLDPRTLLGDFVAATFQHPSLGPAGNATDTTVLYLVTRGHGLTDALLPKLSQIDAAQNLPRVSGAEADTEQTQGAADEK